MSETEYLPGTRCCRPTKSKSECMNMGASRGFPCNLHMTDQDRTYLKFSNEKFLQGWKAGEKSGRSSVLEEQRVAERDKLSALNFRMEVDGTQVVEVNNYAYLWDGKGGPLKVGDKVMLPGGWSRDAWTGTVSRLGSDYRGKFNFVLRRSNGA